MKFVSSYLKEYKIQAILAPLFKMIEAVFELLVPLVMASIINRGIAEGDTAYIIKMGGVLVCLAIVGLVIAITAQYFSAKAAIYTASAIRKDLFVKITSLSASKREQIGEEVLTTRMTSDINQIQSGINMFLRLFLRSPFIVAGAIVMALIVDATSTLVFLAVVGALSIVVALIMKFTLPRYKLIQRKLEKVLHATSENLSGARVIRAFGRENKEISKFEDKTGDLYHEQIITGRVSGLLNPLTYVIVNLGIVGLVYVAAGQVDSGIILQGDVVALINYMSQILIELVKLANLIVLLMKAIPSADRVEEIMLVDSDERTKGNDLPQGYEIRFDDVSFAYEDSKDYDLSHVSVNIPEGSVLGIIGGTGSGKSTLLKLLNHTYEIKDGLATIGGADINKISDKDICALIGIVPQKARLFSGTIASNLRMKAKDASDEDLVAALKCAQAYDFVQEKEGGLNGFVAQNGGNFSGGQRQRLTIARALVGRPNILVFDDSASALDLVTEARLNKALRQLPWHPTLIIVSQRASSVKDADQILVLEDGKVAGKGSHKELLNTCSVYEEIYYCQYPREEACDGL